MGTLNVVELPVGNLNDVPDRLRALAAAIESGEITGASGLVWATFNDVSMCTHVGMVGKAYSRTYAVGCLHAAAFKLLHGGLVHE